MDKDQLAKYLQTNHLGAEYAVNSRVLEHRFSLGGKELRDLINALRRDAVPIASDKNGYYYAKTEQELLATTQHMVRRIAGIAAAIGGLNRSRMVFDKAQICLPLPKGGDGI